MRPVLSAPVPSGDLYGMSRTQAMYADLPYVGVPYVPFEESNDRLVSPQLYLLHN